MTTLAHEDPTVPSNVSALKRAAVFAFGIGSYAIGVVTLVAWILAMLGMLPFTGGPVHLTGASALALNVALMLGFGLQHSIMARASFKAKWTTVVPAAVERSSYVLATGLALGPTVALWQPMSTTVWHVQNASVSYALTGLALLGWGYLFLATFAIDHFELFGLRQVYQYFRGQAVTPVPFKERLMYRIDRHPIMTGALIGMWVTPHMRLDQLLFAASASIYIVIGVYFEERALRRQWGATYDGYAARVGSIVPRFAWRSEEG